MPRRAILLPIAAAISLVSTTPCALAQVSECKSRCGQHWLTRENATSKLSARAYNRLGEYPLPYEAWVFPGTVVEFDARLKTTGGCRETWCNPSPHCGVGKEVFHPYDILGLELRDQNGKPSRSLWG
jgi:hypothetical protein